MARRAEEGWITVTELADTLTRDRGLPFKTSHAIAAGFVAVCTARPEAPRSEVLRQVSSEVTGAGLEYTEEELARILSARHFVAVRTTHGGPAPSVTAKAAEASREALAADRLWLSGRLEGLRDAEQALKTAAEEL